jgi:c-di-GMP-binding flagellar brake protein YcgR
MSPAKTTQKTSLPDSGEQVIIRPKKTDSDFSILGTIAKRTINGILCTISTSQLETYLPALAQSRSSITSFLKPAVRVEIEVSYTRDGGVYRFYTCASAKLSGNAATLAMDLPSSVRKSQRRHDYRLPLAAKVALNSPAANLKITGSLINLSATGAMVICAIPVKSGQTLDLTLLSAEGCDQIESIHAVVIECLSGPDDKAPSKTLQTLRLAFDDGSRVKLPNWQREQIAHYIFEQQRQMLRLRNIVG